VVGFGGLACVANRHEPSLAATKQGTRRLSRDAGKTWGPPIVLRADGGGRALGYPRSVQRADGKVVTVYYFWDEQTGPERYIAATIWAPSSRVRGR
jgi:hypothetical protein